MRNSAQPVRNSTHGSVKKAFTLIELLVVIAIIAILAAILFPVFARARENARRASCQSNLKQLGLGILQYVQDFDERYPANEGVMVSSTVVTGPNWGQKIFPYIKSTEVYRCPSNPATAQMTYNSPLPAPPILAHYALHWRVGRPYNQFGIGLPLSHIEKPSQKIMLSEMGNVVNSGYAFPGWVGANGNRWATFGFAGHLNTANYLFLDGHVKALRPTKTMSDFNMWGAFNNNTVGNDDDCTTVWEINCDTPDAAALAGIATLEAKYQ